MNRWKRYVAAAGLTAVIGLSASVPAMAQEISGPQGGTEKVDAGNVVVTATRNEMDPKDAPGAITVISRQEIEETNARDLVELLRSRAGVTLAGEGVGGRKTITFRGLNSKHTLIMINGMRISASNASIGHSDLENNWVPIEDIERIEVVRGPLSALYGSEAMGGVINIITQPAAKTWTGSVQARGGARFDGNDGETAFGGARLSGPLIKDKLSLNLSAEYSDEEDTPLKEDEKVSEIEGKTVATGSVGLTFTPSRDYSFNVFFNGTDEEREFHNVSRGNYYTDIYDIKKFQAGTRIDAKIGPTDNSLKLYRSSVEKDRPRVYESGTTSYSYDKVVNDVADIQSSFGVLGTRMTLGGELRNEELSSPTMVRYKDDATHSALFVQDELILFDRLSLTAGLRWDHHDTFGSESSPRIYALYKLNEMVNLKAGYGHAFNAPTIKQVSEDYHATTGPHEFYGNPDLKPETADNFEAGVEFYLDKVQAKFFYFHNEIDDMIDWELINQVGYTKHYRAMNIDEARTRGLETEINMALGYGFDLGGSYTYMDAKDTKNDVRLEGKPRHSAGARLRYAYDPFGIWTALRWDYTGAQVLDEEDAPAFSVWNISLGKRITDNFELKCGVDNIGDVRLADKSDLYSYEERGRTFWVGVSASF